MRADALIGSTSGWELLLVLLFIMESKEEKRLDTAHVTDADSDVYFRDKDEALRLVGLERTAVFTEEYYRKLRRKLVRGRRPLHAIQWSHSVRQDFVIPPLCAAVYCTQYL